MSTSTTTSDTGGELPAAEIKLEDVSRPKLEAIVMALLKADNQEVATMSTSVAAASDTVASVPSQEELLELISKLPPDDMKAALKALVQNGEAAAMQVLQDIYKQPFTEMELAWQAYQQHTEELQKLKLDPAKCLDKDLWGQILSFVGPGHYAYVPGVNLQWKHDYEESVTAAYHSNPPPEVRRHSHYAGRLAKRPATIKDTFYRAAFSSISCANFWNQDTMDQNHRLGDDSVCFTVARRGKVEVMKWAKDQGFDWDPYACNNAARYGHLDLLKYLHENDCQWNEYTCTMAATFGHLECLKYAHANECTLGEYTCNWAAGNGHLECLKYAHYNGCTLNAHTCSKAAVYGHTNCIEYARINACPWDKRTCNTAALHGQLEYLKYAHENGCDWDEETFWFAAQGGHMNCLEYLHKEGCPWDATTYCKAVESGHHAVAEWAKNNGCPVDEDEEA